MKLSGERGEGTLSLSAFIFKVLDSGWREGHRIFHRTIWRRLMTKITNLGPNWE
jgi:hypothetical protein